MCIGIGVGIVVGVGICIGICVGVGIGIGVGIGSISQHLASGGIWLAASGIIWHHLGCPAERSEPWSPEIKNLYPFL